MASDVFLSKQHIHSRNAVFLSGIKGYRRWFNHSIAVYTITFVPIFCTYPWPYVNLVDVSALYNAKRCQTICRRSIRCRFIHFPSHYQSVTMPLKQISVIVTCKIPSAPDINHFQMQRRRQNAKTNMGSCKPPILISGFIMRCWKYQLYSAQEINNFLLWVPCVRDYRSHMIDRRTGASGELQFHYESRDCVQTSYTASLLPIYDLQTFFLAWCIVRTKQFCEVSKSVLVYLIKLSP